MTSSLYSPSWYRVASLRPRLRSHVQIHRHRYRGEAWYILQDHVTGRFQRFNHAAYLLIGLMDGEHTVHEIWELIKSRLKEDVPTQEEVIHLLSQLHSVDAMQCDVPPDAEELFKRHEKRDSAKWKQNIKNPLFMSFSLLDPERFLRRALPLVAPLFGLPGAILWLMVVGTGIFLAGVHWPELTQDVTDRVLAPKNVFLLWLTFPFLKILHEFGHAFAIKKLGGEVHDMGIMLLVLTPIPYVDASSASAFRSKWERILVSLAGMAVELFIAAVALFIWINIEPGSARAILYNVIFIAGVSSVLFNGNPLLRYDAYYMLSDLLEIPNLGPKGLQYLSYLMQRYPFGLRNVEPPASTAGERVWFLIYTIASFAYRIFVYVSIVLFIASKFFIAGVLLALWAAVSIIVLPIGKGINFLFTSLRLGRNRGRAIGVTALLLLLLIGTVSFLPFPLNTQAEGVIWVPERAFVRAGTEGFVERLVIPPGATVEAGTPLVICSDPLLPAQIRVLEARLNELKAIYDTSILSNRVQAEITNEEMKKVRGQLDEARKQEKELTVCSSAEGVFFSPMAQDLPGRFVKRGELLGYVLDRSALTARVVVSQTDVDLVRQRTRNVKVRFSERIAYVLPAVMQREVPAATDELPSRILSEHGGGKIAVDPQDGLGLKAFQRIFLFDVELPDYKGLYNVGGRVYVRFNHGWEPLIRRWYRSIRRLFLRRFSV